VAWVAPHEGARPAAGSVDRTTTNYRGESRTRVYKSHIPRHESGPPLTERCGADRGAVDRRVACPPREVIATASSVSRRCHNPCTTPTNTGERPRVNHVVRQRKMNRGEHRRIAAFGLKIRPVSLRVRLGAPTPYFWRAIAARLKASATRSGSGPVENRRGQSSASAARLRARATFSRPGDEYSSTRMPRRCSSLMPWRPS
jgi:hypothetical protein